MLRGVFGVSFAEAENREQRERDRQLGTVLLEGPAIEAFLVMYKLATTGH